MKNKIVLLLSLLVFIPCVVLFSACGKNDKTYHINFIVDEVVYATIDSSGNEYVKLPDNPQKEGYTFEGWYFDKDVWQDKLSTSSFANKEIEQNINVFAYFKEIEQFIDAQSITLNRDVMIMKTTQTYLLEANIYPENTSNKNIIWTSSRNSIVSVENGLIKALSVGKAIITAKTVNNLTATCEVSVVDDNQKISVDVYIDNQKVDTLTTGYNQGYQITAPEKPEDITTNPNADKYFYGWFVDSNYQTPLTEDRTSLSNGKIYGKWINIYSNNYSYSVNKGKATITSFSNTKASTVIVVPCYINSFPVESIDDYVFANQTLLRNVIICDGVKNIGNYAFSNCNSMESIQLPKTLDKIGSNAFQDCEILNRCIIPKNVSCIGDFAFKNCNLLTNINLSNSLTQVGFNVFQDCSSLKTLNYSGTMSDWVRNSVGKSNVLSIIDNFYINGIAVRSTITLPTDIYDINEYAFYNYTNLKNLNIPANIENIANNAFYGCLNLINISFSQDANLEIIGNSAFSRCSKLSTVEIPQNMDKLEKEKLINKYSKQPLPDLAYKFINDYIVTSSDAKTIVEIFKDFTPELNVNIDFANFFVSNYNKILENNIEPVDIDAKLSEIHDNFNMICKYKNKTVYTRKKPDRLIIDDFKCRKIYNNVFEGKTEEESKKYQELAFWAGAYQYEEQDFLELQNLFKESIQLKEKQVLSISPDPLINEQMKSTASDEITYEFIEKNNPKGIFLGDMTNCCQRYNGDGASCMINGVLDVNSGFVTFKLGDEIVGQSWIWYSEKQKAIAFDNIVIPNRVSEKINKEYLESFTNCLDRVTKNCLESMKEKGKEVDKIVIGKNFTNLDLNGKFAFVDNSMISCDRKDPTSNLPCYTDVEFGQYVLYDKYNELTKHSVKFHDNERDK